MTLIDEACVPCHVYVRVGASMDLVSQSVSLSRCLRPNPRTHPHMSIKPQQVVQRLIPQLPTLENLLNYLISACKMEVRT